MEDRFVNECADHATDGIVDAMQHDEIVAPALGDVLIQQAPSAVDYEEC